MRQEIKQYVIGFVICLVLTLSAYLIAVNWPSTTGQPDMVALIILIVLALLQFIAQSIFFLHIGKDKSKRWHSLAFTSMLSVVLIIVIGSIWIMYNLNYNMHHQPSAEEAEQLMLEDEGIEHSH